MRLPTTPLLYSLICVISLFAPILAQAQTYRIGPGDRLAVSVYPDADLDRELTVDPDGMIQMPLLGSVAVTGRTALELAAELRSRLAQQYYRDPHVDVRVVEHVAHRVSVLGAVAEPGVYPLEHGNRVLDLLNRAGGILSENSGLAYVLPPEANRDGTPPEVISLKGLMERGAFGQNVTLTAGSTLFVLPRAQVYVLGAVESPGAYRYTEVVTLMRALSVAGGFTPRAKEQRVWVFRGDPVEKLEFNTENIVDREVEDPPLQPGDLIVVPQRFF